MQHDRHDERVLQMHRKPLPLVPRKDMRAPPREVQTARAQDHKRRADEPHHPHDHQTIVDVVVSENPQRLCNAASRGQECPHQKPDSRDGAQNQEHAEGGPLPVIVQGGVPRGEQPQPCRDPLQEAHKEREAKPTVEAIGGVRHGAPAEGGGVGDAISAHRHGAIRSRQHDPDLQYHQQHSWGHQDDLLGSHGSRVERSSRALRRARNETGP
mmetsp:Transcript_460/g.1012  ORF Transcript_460/g.1012 Transcript_460/m.1012 type:complete len:212 (+) Transcript_460:1742-2377(+)